MNEKEIGVAHADRAPSINEVLASPCAHDYLKETLELFLTKDPVDAVNNAELLLELLSARLKFIQGDL